MKQIPLTLRGQQTQNTAAEQLNKFACLLMVPSLNHVSGGIDIERQLIDGKWQMTLKSDLSVTIDLEEGELEGGMSMFDIAIGFMERSRNRPREVVATVPAVATVDKTKSFPVPPYGKTRA